MKEERKFFTCKYDKMFKKILFSEERKDLTQYFLENILHQKIDSLEFQNVYLESSKQNEKERIMDVLVKIEDEYINIEMNATYRANYTNYKSFQYATGCYFKEARAGQKFIDYKIIQINFTYGLSEDSSYGDVEVFSMHNEKGLQFVDNFKVIVYNMDRFEQIFQSWKDSSYDDAFIEPIKEAGLPIILNRNLEELEKLDLIFGKTKEGDQFMEKYATGLKVMNESNALIWDMTKEEMDEMDKQNLIAAGEKTGRENGLQEKSIEIAKNLLHAGMDVSFVASNTGLSIDEVNLLK